MCLKKIKMGIYEIHGAKNDLASDENCFKVLIVDDDENQIDLVKLMLQKYKSNKSKLHILTASSKNKAIEILSENNDIAIVLLDLVMEEDTGLEIVKYIREVIDNKIIRIILISEQIEEYAQQFIIQDYDINDFNKKDGFLEERLFNSITLELRSYNTLKMLENYQDELEMAYLTLSDKNVLIEYHKNQLQHHISTQDKLYSIIAHDLRTSLGNMLSFSKLLKDNYAIYSDKKKEEFIGLLEISAEQGFELLENLLEWTRAQTGRIHFSPTALNLKDVIDRVLKSFIYSAECKKIKLLSLVDDNSIIIADKKMLQTILRNLISNAIKFTKADGQVFVKKVETADFIEIDVYDTGVGISKEDIDKLFHSDSHFSSFGTDDEKGTGLGLLICEDFVKKHKGEMRVESEVGVGSSFLFTISKLLRES